jgi:hypothetical protein
MANELLRACQYLDIKEQAVLSFKVYEAGGYISLVIDNGIKGCPKYTIPLDKLPDLPEPDAIKVVDVEPEPAPKPKSKQRKAQTRRRKVTKRG